MPGSNSRPQDPEARGPFRLEDAIAPLLDMQPEPPTGRVRSLDEARRALRIPTSPTPQVMRAWGTPADFQLTVYPVSDPELPDLVAEFAILRVIARDGDQLTARPRDRRLRLHEKSNALWLVYGSIVVAADTRLVIETLAISPAFPSQLASRDDEIALGISGKLLRLISPPQILSACTERLTTDADWLQRIASNPNMPATPDAQRITYERIKQAAPRRSRVSDEQLANLAKHYVTLCFYGVKNPRVVLAQTFGLTTTQARDRIHQARQRGYLTKGTQGRATATAGPTLTALGWQPPQPLTPPPQQPPKKQPLPKKNTKSGAKLPQKPHHNTL